MTKKSEHVDMIREAWNAYHADYMAFNLRESPHFYEHLAAGGTMLDDHLIEMAGDIRGLKLLDVCCAGDAQQAFSWANLGAIVTASDISPKAIEIARENAERIGLPVSFHVADAQRLEPLDDVAFDIVFASYLWWFQDIPLACRNWSRVLRSGGRLLIDFGHHPIVGCLEEKDCNLAVEHPYFDTGPEYYEFTGTPLADRHGGWGRAMPIVGFHHTLAHVLNSVAGAGFRIENVVESGDQNGDGPLSKLPTNIALLARKPDEWTGM